MSGTLPDGLYRVTMCAPILRRKLSFWVTVAVRIN